MKLQPKTKEQQPHYTKTPSVVVFWLVEHPVSLLILHYVLIRKNIYPKFRVNDMATRLRKDAKTIRAAVKPLVRLGLLTLKGRIGAQYYEFSESKYESYIWINPFEAMDDPSQKAGVVPCQKAAGAPLPNNGRSPLPKSGREESKEKEEIENKRKEVESGSQPPSTLAAVAPKQMSGEEAEAFERFFRSEFHQSCQPTSTPEGIKEENHGEGSQPPSPSVAPSTETHAASGGVEVGLPSTPVARPSSDSNSIQGDYRQSDAGGQNKPETFLARVSAPIVQPPVNGTTNTGALKKTVAHRSKSARVASSGLAFGFTDAERQELASKGYTEDNITRMESAYVLGQFTGPHKEKSRHGRGS